MGHVMVIGATVAEAQIASLKVRLHGLPERSIDRDTALAWMKDGHSLVPLLPSGATGTALQRVEVPVEGESAWFIRDDNAPEPADKLPELPAAAESGS